MAIVWKNWFQMPYNGARTKFKLPLLPYAYDALAPYISRETLEVHHGKHHRGYVDSVNMLAAEAGLADQTLETIILKTANHEKHTALFNNAAQAWNHAFYWRSLRPGGGGEPFEKIAGLIENAFESHQNFSEKLADAATAHFGSGWAWLVLDGGRLKVTSTANGDTPLAHGLTPLLAIDVWEHAYYLDYQNKRADYITAVLKHLLNWEFANQNLSGLKSAVHGAG